MLGLLLTAWVSISISGPLFSQSLPASLPDAGVSDKYLVSLGTAAENFLITRLRNAENERYYSGIVSRLSMVGDVEQPNRNISNTLVQFIDKQSQRNGDIGDTLYVMDLAFRVIGQRGGDEGLDYLIEWVTTDHYVKRVRCFVKGVGVSHAQNLLLTAAFFGLGETGTEKAREVLMDLKRRPPPLVDPKRFAGYIDDVIDRNERIRDNGLEEIYQCENELFKRYNPWCKPLRARNPAMAPFALYGLLGRIPEAGISDEYLLSLGTAAESYLISKLEERSNERHFRGIVDKLVWQPPLGRVRPVAFHALQRFVALNMQRQEDVGNTEMAMFDALKAMGFLGGDEGVDYLADWLRTSRYIDNVRCTRTGVSSREALRQGALLGLGLSGSEKAHDVLTWLKRHRRKSWNANFEDRVNGALIDNEGVRKKGFEKYVMAGRQTED